MYISRIQGSTQLYPQFKTNQNSKVQYARKPYVADIFVKNNQNKEISFNGRVNIFEKMMQKYLEQKSYKTSILTSFEKGFNSSAKDKYGRFDPKIDVL